jgi:2-polyprenyl-3-methyl-5-hydroxy-6-metoxy-1,4-benzoquinol methylase
MRRETTNYIRFFLEELLPPIFRDSRLMRWLFRRHWGSLIDELEEFRSNAHQISDEDYARIYAALPRVHQGTDNSSECIRRIIDATLPGDVLDVGCGTGFLLSSINAALGQTQRTYTGLDFQIDPETRKSLPDIRFEESIVERMPFADNSFDTLICTHLLEHILDIRTCVNELRRVCRKRLIIVVPQEREYRFTFNPHLHFFPYRHSFLKFMLPVPANAICENVGRDFFYVEDYVEQD